MVTTSGIVCIAGPTAVGKSRIAQDLALLIQGEIVSVDSMQVYRGLDIGTAKPSVRDRELVPHHLVDVVEMSEAFDAGAWVSRAREVVAGITARNRQAVLCGGTGLYFKAFFEGLGAAPAGDPAIRQELEQTPLAELLMELEREDPVTFARIDRKNARRVVRAVEVVRLSGRAYSEQRVPWKKAGKLEKAGPECQTRWLVFVGIEREKPDLRQRIDERVERMFELGLVEETKGLLERGLAQNRTAMQAIGYRQVVEFLQGQRTLKDTMTEVRNRTWQLARRQMNWFRHQAGVEWLKVQAEENLASVAERLARQVRPGRELALSGRESLIQKKA